MYEYIIEPEAQKEYEQSVYWYKQRSEQATKKFIEIVQTTIKSICKNPYSNLNKHKKFYELKTPKYPFTIIYTIEENKKIVIIFSIYHHKRNPKNKFKK